MKPPVRLAQSLARRSPRSPCLPVLLFISALSLITVPRLAVAQSHIFATPAPAAFTSASTLVSPHWTESRSFGATANLDQLYPYRSLQEFGMADMLQVNLTPQLFKGLREFWFEHLSSEDDFVVANQEHMKPWFMGDDAFDQICTKRFSPALEAIRAAGVTTGAEILSAVTPSTPLDWLSLVLLLDQMPRNCYRAEEAGVVFQYFDPLARDIAAEALARGMVDQPEIRWNFTRRMWFFVPLMHSERLEDHKKSLREYERMQQDVEGLVTLGQLSDDAGDQDPQRQKAAKVVKANAEAARAMALTQLDFEKKHYVIIERFGRYPHRNKVMGREPTAEETEYLENGGETFGS